MNPKRIATTSTEKSRDSLDVENSNFIGQGQIWQSDCSGEVDFTKKKTTGYEQAQDILCTSDVLIHTNFSCEKSLHNEARLENETLVNDFETQLAKKNNEELFAKINQ